MRVRRLLRAPLVTASMAVVAAAAPARAQTPWPADGGRVLFSSSVVERPVRLSAPLVHHDGRYIVVHLRENRVFVFEGSEAVWSAPAGTGTGFRLASEVENYLQKLTNIISISQCLLNTRRQHFQQSLQIGNYPLLHLLL